MLSVAKFNSHDSASDIRIDVSATAMTCKITIREMIDLNRITFVLSDQISDTAHGMNLYSGSFVGKLPSKTMDIDLDSIRGDISG